MVSVNDLNTFSTWIVSKTGDGKFTVHFNALMVYNLLPDNNIDQVQSFGNFLLLMILRFSISRSINMRLWSVHEYLLKTKLFGFLLLSFVCCKIK